MSTTDDIWNKLEDPEDRKLFVEEMAKRAFATQVRTIRQLREWSQERLAKEAGIDQSVVSRTEDPSLGKRFDTAAQVASGFDLAFIPKIVTFAEFVRWIEEVSDGYTDLPTFAEERDSNNEVANLLREQALARLKKKPLGEPNSINRTTGPDIKQNKTESRRDEPSEEIAASADEGETADTNNKGAVAAA